MEEKFSTGVLWQDYQHQKLIELLVKLNRSKSNSSDGNTFLYSISFLALYVNEHFGMEEQYMKKFNYPDMEFHIQEHKKFIADIKNFREKYSDYSDEHLNTLLKTIKEWIQNHILGDDKKLGAFITSQAKCL